jgi:hypothetical protein
MTETGGRAWRLTDSFAAGAREAAPILVTSAVHDGASGAATVFALNRSIDTRWSSMWNCAAWADGAWRRHTSFITTIQGGELEGIPRQGGTFVASVGRAGKRAAESEIEAVFPECFRNTGRGRPGLKGCETWIGR